MKQNERLKNKKSVVVCFGSVPSGFFTGIKYLGTCKIDSDYRKKIKADCV